MKNSINDIIMKLIAEIFGREGRMVVPMFRSPYWVDSKVGLKQRVKTLESEVTKLKAIVAEVTNTVYKDNK